MEKLFIFICALCVFSTDADAQNSSPYWSLAGNNNATTNSKLGTVNSVPLRMMTKNTEWIRIDTLGRIGIGTTTPAQKLHVVGHSIISGNLGVGVSPSQKLHVAGNGVFTGRIGAGTITPSEQLHVVGNSIISGNLGVGVTPAQKLHVAGNGVFTGRIGIGTTSPSQPLHVVGNTLISGNLGIGVTPTQKLHISGNGVFTGSVGIGTTTPAFTLDVRAASVFGQFKSTAGYAGVIIDKPAANQNGYVIIRTAGVDKWTAGTNGNDNFGLRNWALGTNALTIDITNNNVGIGAIVATSKLNVVGSTSTGAGITASGYNYGLSANSTSAFGYAVFGNSAYLGVYGYAPSGSYGTYGYSNNIGAYGSGTTYGVYGYSGAGTAGVHGNSSSGYGVQGISNTSYGGNFESTGSWALRASTTNGYYAGVFYGAVWTSVGYYTSDKNLKKDVREFGDAMSIINKLKPQEYLFRDDAKYATLNLPKGRHYGLLAQDLEEVLPNLVSEAPHELNVRSKATNAVKPTADGTPQPIVAEAGVTKETIKIKAVNYVELIPIMIKAMQEQEIKAKEQEVEIATLKSELNELKALILKNANTSTVTPVAGYLKQNNPNPSNGTAVIKYFAPSGAGNAQIVVTDMKGSILKTYKITPGEGQLLIKSGEFPSGIYNYTLYLKNNKIDTKQMIIAR